MSLRKVKKVIKKIIKVHQEKLIEKEVEMGFYQQTAKELWPTDDEQRFNFIEGRLRFWQDKKPDQRPKEFDKWIVEIRELNERRTKSGVLEEKIEGKATPGALVTIGGLRDDIWLIEKYIEYLESTLKNR